MPWRCPGVAVEAWGALSVWWYWRPDVMSRLFKKLWVTAKVMPPRAPWGKVKREIKQRECCWVWGALREQKKCGVLQRRQRGTSCKSCIQLEVSSGTAAAARHRKGENIGIGLIRREDGGQAKTGSAGSMMHDASLKSKSCGTHPPPQTILMSPPVCHYYDINTL